MMGSDRTGGRLRPTNRIGGSYTGPVLPVTVSPRRPEPLNPRNQRHASSGWGAAPVELQVILAALPATDWTAISMLARAYWPAISRWPIADRLHVTGDLQETARTP